MERITVGPVVPYVKIMLMEARARKYNSTNQNTVSMLKIGAPLYWNNSIPCGKNNFNYTPPPNQCIEDIYTNTINIVSKDLTHLCDV